MLDGLCPPIRVQGTGETSRVVTRPSGIEAGKVGIVTGGGSGHLPLFTGYVGEGLLDACAIGNVFAVRPSPAAARRSGRRTAVPGCCASTATTAATCMNFDMAGEMAEMEAIPTRTVLGTDDIASAPPAEGAKRRGVAGIVFAYKAAGAKAVERASLDDVAAVAAEAVARTRTIGVALSPCRMPTATRPSFAISRGRNGVRHGHPRRARHLARSRQVRRRTRGRDDGAHPGRQAASAGKRVAVLVNSLGATPLEELFIIYRHLATRLTGDGYTIARSLVGHFVTSMEMAGASISICFLGDELERLLGRPAKCPFWSV